MSAGQLPRAPLGADGRRQNHDRHGLLSDWTFRDDGLRTTGGRQIPPTREPPAFSYLIADLTDKMIERCEISDLRPTHDGLGYFGFNNSAKAYIEVTSFDGLVNAATESKRAFFDKSGLPS